MFCTFHVHRALGRAEHTEPTGRRHIYVADPAQSQESLLRYLRPSEKEAPAELPAPAVWVAEGAFDRSVFYGLRDERVADDAAIVQYEVENKYRPLPVGEMVLDYHRDALVTTFGAEQVLDSKFRTAMLALMPGRVPS